MKKQFKHISQLALLILSPVFLMGQTEDDDLGTEEITVVKDYDPSISDAQMIFWQPSEVDTSTEAPKLTYALNPTWYKTRFDYKNVPAVRIGRVKADKLYRSFARVGFGNYTTPLAEIFITNRRSKDHNLGIYARHLSSAGGIKDLAYNGYARNDIQLWGKRMYKSQSLSADLFYDHDRNYYYAFLPSDTAKEDIRQDYQTIGFNLQYASSTARAKSIVDRVDLGYHHFFDGNKAAEHFVKFNGVISAPIQEELFEMGIPISYNNSQFEEIEQNYFLAGIQPSVVSNFGPVFFRLGIDMHLATKLDPNSSTSKAYFYPEVDIKYSIIDNVLFAYAGMNGELEHRTFRTMILENPFLKSGFEIKPQSKQYDFFIGMKGALSSQASFNVSANYAAYKDYALFLNDTSPSAYNMMDVVYDDLKVFHLEGELLYQQSDRFETWAKASFDQYNTSEQREAWHLPNLKLSFGGRYNMADKFLFSGDLFVVGARKAANGFTDYTSSLTLNPYADLNLGFEYRYSPVLSAYLQMNNLLAQKYELWNGYTAQRFNIMGGFTYRF